VNPTQLFFPKEQISNWIPLDLNNINYIILHHAESDTASPELINEWHLANGWKGGFGYNEYIRKDGSVYIGRGDFIGAQCLGYNSISYGICCEGDYQRIRLMPEVQKKALVERIKYNSKRFPNYKATIPHKQFVDTECPGLYFPTKEILIRVEELDMDWKEIIREKTDSPDRWITAIETLVKIADTGNLGDLEITKYFPNLIEKISNK
jgi:hypothetical protein